MNAVAVINSSLPDYEVLATAAVEQGMKVMYLTHDKDSLSSLVEQLALQPSPVQTLHILCHGQPGTIFLGNTRIANDTIPTLSDKLAQLGQLIQQELFLYACSTAQGDEGAYLLSRLQALLEVNISASSSPIGSPLLGGSWVLDVSTVHTHHASLAVPAYQHLLAPTTITFSADDPNWDTDSIAQDGEGGSADYPEAVLQFYNIRDINGTKLESINWFNSIDLASADGFNGITVDYNSYIDEWAGMAIKSSGGTTFQLESFDFYDWGSFPRALEQVNVVGFRNSMQVAFSSFNSNNDDNRLSINISNNTNFDNVDEVRIYYADGSGYTAINNIVVDNAVALNIPPQFSSPNTFSVNETAINDNAVLLDVQADNGDGGLADANITYSITGGTGQTFFSIDADDGEIRLNAAGAAALDYETATSYTLTVQADDGEGSNNTATQDITISVNDIAPLITSGQSFNVNESTTNSSVLGTVANTGDNDSISWSIQSGNDAGIFAINAATGEITLSDTSQLDASATGSYTLGVQATDGTTSSTENITITVLDDVVPSVTSIAPSGSPNTNATSMDFTVTFSESVSNVSVDDFTLAAMGTASGTISAVAGSGDSYTVSVTGISGEGNLRLDLNAGTNIDDGATNTPSGYNSGTAHNVDRVQPTVTNVTSPSANGTYKAGDTVTISLNFSETVIVTGTPQLTLETGATDRVINYTAGSGTSTLTFAYTVQAGDESTDLALAGSAILLNSGTIRDTAGNDTVVILPTPGTAGSLSANKDIVIDAVAPTISSVSIANGSHKIGDAVTVSISAGEAGLSLVSGTINGVAVTGFTDQGGGNYTATYTVQESDTDRAPGDDIPVNVVLADAVGNTSTAYTTPVSQNADAIDAARPMLDGAIVPSVATITDAQVGSGSFTLTLTFSEAMNTGVAPTITFPTENPLHTLSFNSGSWKDATTYTATFDTADANEVVNNVDVRISDAQDAAGNTLTAVTQSDLFSIITAPAPTVQAITTLSAIGTLAVGSTIDIAVTFDEAVDFTANGGIMSATLNTGATVILASSDSANQMQFSGIYTVQEGEIDTARLNVTSLNLVGGATLAAHDDAVPANLGTLPGGQNLADNALLAVDANTPATSPATLTTSSDSGVSDNDNLTNQTTPTITGTGTEAGATVDVRVAGASVGSSIADASGDWVFTFAAGDLSEGSNIVDTVVRDSAGNIGNDSADLILTLDTTAPTASDDTAATVQEDAGMTVLTGVNAMGDNVIDNDIGVDTTAPIVAVNSQANNLGIAVAGSNGGRFIVTADGTASFDPNGEFAALAHGETRTTSVTVDVQDTAGNISTSTLSVTVDGVNSAPTIATNAGPSVQTGRSITLTTDHLNEGDPDDEGEGLSYTLNTLSVSGTLSLSGTALAVGDTFTQQDINDGLVSFVAGNSAGSASFDFTLTDGGEDGVASVSDTLTFSVQAPPSPTPTTPIQISPPRPLPDMPSGRPSISETITNSGSTPAAVKLVENTGSTNEVTAVLPGGYTLINQGPRTAADTPLLWADLIASINGQQPGNLNDQTGLASQWLNNRPAGTLLDIRTLVISDPNGSNTNTPVQINGIAGNNTNNTGRQEAFVIDVSALPSSNQLELNHIDFVSVIGATTITGGTGNNVVVGDNAAQFIVLGEGDDELYGGGGDDIIGSESGNDRLFGGDGNDEVFGGAGMDLLHGGRDIDVASYAGNRDEYLVTQEHGVITVSLKADPSDTDTLVNIEQLRFADDEESISYSNDLEWITGLYAQALGRQGDVDGVQYWAQQHAAGLNRADMAMLFVNSLEAGKQLSVQNSDADAMLDTLYQVLLGREADAEGKVYWLSQVESGGTLRDVVEGFMASTEMRSHDLIMTQWDFIA